MRFKKQWKSRYYWQWLEQKNITNQLACLYAFKDDFDEQLAEGERMTPSPKEER